MNWLVTWIVVTWSIVACPPPQPVYDIYRGEVQSMNLNLVACYDTEEKSMQKYFSTYEEALEFVNKGKEQCNYSDTISIPIIADCDLRDFEIIKLSD